MIDLMPVLHLLFRVVMGGFMPVRKRGMFGTEDAPVYFDAGDTVPWWIECRWPLRIPVKFRINVETYYLDGQQIVQALEDTSGCGMDIGCDGKSYKNVLLVGAPTCFIGFPRKRPKLKAKYLRLCEQL